MMRWIRPLGAAILAATIVSPATACSLCAALYTTLTFRQEAEHPGAKMIVYGSLANARPNVGGTGVTDLNIESVLRNHAFLKDKKVLQLERYIPVTDPKDPPKFLLFCDLFNEKLDPYRGVPVKSRDVVAYIEGAMKLPGDDPVKRLMYFADFLENPDSAIADDAFLEFAKSTDQELGQVSGKIPAQKLRAWIKDPKVPGPHVGLYAFLLGGCGTAEDADMLRGMLTNPTDRILTGFDGMLSGFIQLDPKRGWDMAYGILQSRDDKQRFESVQAVIRCMRCFHGWKPKEQRDRILHGMELALTRNDIADLAINDLRRWQEWDLNKPVLALYGKKGYDAPIMRRAILAYAISSKSTEGKNLVDQVRKTDPDFVADVQDGLDFEKKK
jgi:hypothetical protein